MFLLVSVRHVGAHPGEYQHGVSIQVSISLGKTFLRISRIGNVPLTWILARVFVYVPPFISQILDLIYWTVLIFILIYFKWRDTENQPIPVVMGVSREFYKNKIPREKTKTLTAKPKTSRQKQVPTAKPKLFCFCCEVFGFAVRYFVFAVRFLVLPWGILFLPWGFWFCRDVFVLALRFLVLPWQLWATISHDISTGQYWVFLRFIRGYHEITEIYGTAMSGNEVVWWWATDSLSLLVTLISKEVIQC